MTLLEQFSALTRSVEGRPRSLHSPSCSSNSLALLGQNKAKRRSLLLSNALERLNKAARQLKTEVLALSFAARDPRTPWLARAFALLVLTYALSPIDLIPDFIPVLGYLDDLLLVPAGLWLALRLIPPDVMAQARLQAEGRPQRPAKRAWGLLLILVIYAALIGVAWRWWGGSAR